MAGNVVEITSSNWDSEVVNSDKPVLIDFWASWCSPCRIMAPIMEEIAIKYGDKVKVGKLNVDEYPEIASQFGVMSIPTFILFEKGIPKKFTVGAKSMETLLTELGII
ncbi:MAG: thioredoxin [Actinobacteria bacterium]|nr:thioredoxin [Actinomycetota bacterium]